MTVVDEAAWSEDTYERPKVESELIADLSAAIAPIQGLHEAYVVTRRRVHRGRQKVGLGIVAHVGGRWRSRPKIAAANDALRPFFPERLQWYAIANSPVPDEARIVGIRLGGHS
jgi:hypothetical protein